MRPFVKRNLSFLTSSLDGGSTHSFGSTVSVVPSKPSLKIVLDDDSRARATQTKTVIFDESRNVYSKAAANTRYAKTCWYQAEEYIAFKSYATAVAKQLVMSTKESNCFYKRVLTTVYRVCCSVPSGIDDASLADDLLCKKDAEDLRTCVSGSNARLGLERSTIEVLHRDVPNRRKLMRRTVHEIQTVNTISQNVKTEMIQKALEPISQPSRLFAHQKAIALETSS